MNILYTTCFLDVSGVTKINLDILAGISNRFNISICETVSDEKLMCKMDDYFRENFGAIFQLWRSPATDRFRLCIRYLEDHAIDLIYNTHSLWLYEHAARLKRELPGIRIVDSLHVLEPYCFRGGYPDISANRFVHPYIDKSIVISEHLLSYIRRNYAVDTAKFVVIQNGIDTNRFRKDSAITGVFRKEIGVPSDVPLIGFLGRFTRQKRPELFLNVARLLTDHLDKVHFYMVGSGDLTDESKQLAGKLGIADRVRFVPPRDDIHVVLNSTDMVLVTSSYEGAPLTILEALATGVPVVSSDVGAIMEYIGSEWLVAPGSGEVAKLAETVMKRFQPNVTQHFDSERYEISTVVSRYAEVFESLLTE